MSNIKEKVKKLERVDYTSKNIYVGLDVHKKNWYATVYVEQQFIKTFHLESSGAILLKFLQNNYTNGIYHACYEAGFCGFSVQRELTSLGIQCIVVNACDIPQTQKGALSKTDASDSRRIGEAFAKQMLKPIYIPDKISEADRNLIRYRKRTQELLKAKKQGIKSCLNILGISIPDEHDKPYWTNNFIKWLRELKIEEFSGKATVDGLVEDAIFFRKKLLMLNKEIKKLSISDKYKEMYTIIASTPGIGLITGMTLLTEVVDINRFENFTKFNSFIGLCPSEFSSGEKERKGKMTSRSNKQIRSLLIEAAWIAIRIDPALTLKYQDLLTSKTKKRAIVIIARKLLSRIFKIWKAKEPYENGIIK